MKVITAVEDYMADKSENEISVFLAGGITNCWEWQKEVIKNLEEKEDTDKLIVYNPRRENFPIHDPNASEEQIKWEFDHLNEADIFSMYFCSGTSDQPICMYELGRYVESMKRDYFLSFGDRIVISIEEGYKRKQDVIIQTKLAFKGLEPNIIISDDFKTLCKLHANSIYNQFKIIRDEL